MINFNFFRNRTIAAAVSLLSALTLASCWENFSDGFMGVRESSPPAITLADSTMTSTSVTLNWTEPDAVSYSGTRITCDGNGSTTEITVARGTTTYTITGLTGGFEYTITTRAVYSTGHESSGTSFKITPSDKSVRFTYSAEHLNDVRNGLGDHCVLMADIDLSEYADGKGWIPIESFTGTFDGNGHAVRNLTINDSAGDNKGLFGSTAGAKIQNLALKDVSVNGNKYVSGLVGNSTGGTTISNCTVEGTVSGNSTHVGGLVGNQTSGTITGCSFTGSVSGNSTYVGGLAGYSTAVITGSSATGTVSGINRYVGGLVGHCQGGSITNSHTAVDVSSNSISAGGLVGHNDGAPITNCYATGSVTGSSSVGGLVGFVGSGTTITKCYATGNVLIDTSVGNEANAGGLVGRTGNVTITKCYALGNVTVHYPGGNPVWAGSLAGFIGGGTVQNSFARGNVDANITSGSNINPVWAGGLVGQTTAGTVQYCYSTGSVVASTAGSGAKNINGFANTAGATACYYDITTSGIADDGNNANGIGKIHSDMILQSTYQPGTNNWDFDTIWSISPSINGGYPYLTGLAP